MSKFNKRRLVVALLAMAGLLILTHIPEKYMPDGLETFDLDKILHIMAYGMLTALMIMAIKSPRTWTLQLALFVILLVLAIADETTQAFVNRTASLADWLADIIGIIIALLTCVWFNHSKRQVPVKTVGFAKVSSTGIQRKTLPL